MGVKELGAVYASEQEHLQYRADVERASVALKIKLKSYTSTGNLAMIAKSLTPDTPRILLFIGSTPELVQFTQGIDKQAQQRFLVAMADVNLQTMAQMGSARHIPVMATQVVPMVNATLPVVKAYRETLARLFDEPATPQSLAGYIAARYTRDVLNTVEGAPTRQNTLLAFQQRHTVDVARLSRQLQCPKTQWGLCHAKHDQRRWALGWLKLRILVPIHGRAQLGQRCLHGRPTRLDGAPPRTEVQSRTPPPVKGRTTTSASFNSRLLMLLIA